MKKLVVYLCLGAMVLSLTACGGGNDENNANTEQTVETTPAPQATPGAEESQPTESAPGEDDLAGENAVSGWSQEMENIKTAVVESIGENYFPNMPLDAQQLETIFGITSDMYEDYMAEMPMISTNVDTLLIIKAKDDKVEAVEEALNTYRDAMVEDTMQYPMNVGKIQASRIERIGNYVCFVQLGGDVMAAAETGDEAVIAQCSQANELVIEVINQNVEH